MKHLSSTETHFVLNMGLLSRLFRRKSEPTYKRQYQSHVCNYVKVSEEPTITCYVCGKVLEVGERHRCTICGDTRYVRRDVERYVSIRAYTYCTPYGCFESKYYYLCMDCYKKLEDLIDLIIRRIKEKRTDVVEVHAIHVYTGKRANRTVVLEFDSIDKFIEACTKFNTVYFVRKIEWHTDSSVFGDLKYGIAFVTIIGELVDVGVIGALPYEILIEHIRNQTRSQS